LAFRRDVSQNRAILGLDQVVLRLSEGLRGRVVDHIDVSGCLPEHLALLLPRVGSASLDENVGDVLLEAIVVDGIVVVVEVICGMPSFRKHAKRGGVREARVAQDGVVLLVVHALVHLAELFLQERLLVDQFLAGFLQLIALLLESGGHLVLFLWLIK
jgi:hypothetical protein